MAVIVRREIVKRRRRRRRWPRKFDGHLWVFGGFTGENSEMKFGSIDDGWN